MNCKECKEENFRTTYFEPIKFQMIERKLCFTCNFWYEKVLIKDSDTCVRVNGHHYHLSSPIFSKELPSSNKGFGGRIFKIKFNDGREIETDNLSHNGKIPEHFLNRLPDNAVVIKEKRPDFKEIINSRKKCVHCKGTGKMAALRQCYCCQGKGYINS